MKIPLEIVFENIIVFKIKFSAFFCDVCTILGGPGAPGPSKKSPKIVQDTQNTDLGMRLGNVFERGFWEGVGTILGGFWKGFGRMLGG